MLPLEMVYDFDPIPPRPNSNHAETQKTFEAPPSSSEEQEGIDIEVELEVGCRNNPENIGEVEDNRNSAVELGNAPEEQVMDDVDQEESSMHAELGPIENGNSERMSEVPPCE